MSPTVESYRSSLPRAPFIVIKHISPHGRGRDRYREREREGKSGTERGREADTGRDREGTEAETGAERERERRMCGQTSGHLGGRVPCVARCRAAH